MKSSRGILGYVVLGNIGTFKDHEEQLEDHGQLPQFLPRMSWPREEDAKSNEKSSGRMDLSCSSRYRPYRTLKPMPPFEGNLEYDTCPWSSHLAVVHEIFHRGLYRVSGIETEEMLALLRIASYGMYNSMTFFDPWVIKAVDPSETGFREHIGTDSDMWHRTYEMLRRFSKFGTDMHDITNCQEKIRARRWVVVPILYGTSQWCMTIFDRSQGQLYIFDCGKEQARDERIRACNVLWYRFLTTFRLIARTFSYFVPPVSEQPSDKDSGLLCIIWLMNTLRDQVGPVMTSEDAGVETQNYIIRDAHSVPILLKSSLHL